MTSLSCLAVKRIARTFQAIVGVINRYSIRYYTTFEDFVKSFFTNA